MFSPSLSVLAVAIFSFRKTNLMKVQSYNAAEVINVPYYTPLNLSMRKK